MTRRKRPKWLDAARAAGPAHRPGAKPDWIARALARAGVLAAADAERAVRDGRVALDGRTIREPLTLVPPGAEVRLDGRPVSLAFRTLAIALHKPAGVVTAPHDPEGKGTVFDVLAAALPDTAGRTLHAVGRLDRDTTGLLLFTNDERLVEHATAPATHLPKRYVARVAEKATDAQLEPLRRGVTLDDGAARPAGARLRAPGVVELVISEGRHHQVKRMLAAVGLPVLALHREAVGGLVLDVGEREARVLTDDELRDELGYEPRAG